MAVFKIFGMLMIFIACTLWGFLKASNLKKRSRKLSLICVSLEKSAQLMRSFQGDIGELLQRSFDRDILINGKLNSEYLSEEDIKLFEKFLLETGMSNRESEFKRIKLFESLFEKQSQLAQENESRLYKLYNSLGILIGVSVCIFFV